MFRFENAQYLYLLLVLVALTAIHYYIIYRKKQQMKRFGDPDLVRQLYLGVSRWRPEVKFWLAMAALVFFIVGLARPQFGTRLDTRERTGIEAIIALDVSNSMLAEDVKPNRLEKAKMMVSNMVDGMRDDKVGLIVYAGQAFTQLPITSDYVSAKMFLESVSPSMISVQGTDIAEAIRLSMRSFTQQEDVTRAIFIITDGEDNEGGAVEAAKEAAEHGIRTYVLGIGNPGGAPIPIPGSTQYIIDEEGNTVVSKLNEEMCREIATAGHGNYIYVDNSSSAQKKLSEYLDRLSKVKIESQMYSEYDEQYQGFILIGLLLLLIDVLLLERQSKSTWLSRLFHRGGAVVLLLMVSTAMMAQSDRDYVRRGNRYMRKGQKDSINIGVMREKAQVEYRKAIEKDNTNPVAHYNLGNALLFQNKAEEAMKSYDAATKFEKDPKRLAQIYHNMGVVFQSAKQYDKAVASYRQSLRNDPTNDETRYNYALALSQLKKNQQDQQQDQQDQKKDDQGKNEKEEKQQQQQQQQDKQDQKDEPQQQQPKPDQMSRENAEQMLKAAMQDEKQTQDKIQRAQQQHQTKRLQKQW